LPFEFFKPTPRRVDAQHAAGIIEIMFKNNMAVNFLRIPIDAAAWISYIVGFNQNIAAGFDKQLKKIKKEF